MNTLTNQVTLVGYLGGDPETRQFENSKKASFTMATSQNFKSTEGEWVTETQWHSIVAWGKLSEITAKLFRKGTYVMVVGKIMYNNYEDKEGVKRTKTEIVMNDFIKLTKDEADKMVKS